MARTRCVVTEAYYRELLAEARESGESLNRFARRRGLDWTLLYRWRKELKERDAQPKTAVASDPLAFLLPKGARIYLATKSAPMQLSCDAFCGLVRDRLGRDPLSGDFFAFGNSARNRLRIVTWGGSGLWVLAKRLERGTFPWPRFQAGETHVELTAAQFAAFLSQQAWQSLRRP